MHPPVFSYVLQTRLAVGLCPCSYTCGHLLFIQVCSAPTPVVRAECIPQCSVVLCKRGSQLACGPAITPMDTCCSYRCSVTQHQCTATLVRAECLYAEQIFISVFADTQACRQPVLQSSTERWAMHFAKTSAAVH